MNKTRETTKLHTPIFDVVEKEFDHVPNFKPVGLNCPGWVMVIALDRPVKDDPITVLVKQTRWGIEDKTIEFPCGTIEAGEAPKHAAVREFEEETGIKISEEDLYDLGSSNPNPAMFNNEMHFYLYYSKNLLDEFRARGNQMLDEDEDCEVFVSRLNNHLKDLIKHCMGAAAVGFLSTADVI